LEILFLTQNVSSIEIEGAVMRRRYILILNSPTILEIPTFWVPVIPVYFKHVDLKYIIILTRDYSAALYTFPGDDGIQLSSLCDPTRDTA